MLSLHIASPLRHLVEFRTQRLPMIERLAREGEVYPFRLLSKRVLSINSPALIEHVLTRHHDELRKTPGLNTIARPLLGSGLLTVEPPAHRQRRALLAQAFTPKRVERYIERMAAKSGDAVAEWKSGQVIDAARVMSELTLGIVADILFSSSVEDDVTEIYASLTEALSHVIAHMGLPFAYQEHWPRMGKRRFLRNVARIDAVVRRILAAREQSNKLESDILSVLIAAAGSEQSAISVEEVRDEIATFILAGHETTASLLCWLLLLLADHPEAQERCACEAATLPQQIVAADLDKLAFVRMCVLEGLRLYPPAYFMSREAAQPMTIAGHALATGDRMWFPIYGIHRNEQLWPQADRFVPERFAAKRFGVADGFLPFGTGPRVCIGNHFAVSEALVIVASIVRAFRLERVGEWPAKDALVTLRPQGPAYLRLHRRAV